MSSEHFKIVCCKCNAVILLCGMLAGCSPKGHTFSKWGDVVSGIQHRMLEQYDTVMLLRERIRMLEGDLERCGI